MGSDLNTLRFTPIQSFVDSSFFAKLARLKLEKFKLDSSTQYICGFQTRPSKLNKFDDIPTLALDEQSFVEEEIDKDSIANDRLITSGSITNLNTIEEFKAISKQDLLHSWGEDLYQQIMANDTFEYKIFQSFKVLSYSDLKKYKFYYWVSFPTLQSSWTILERNDVIDSGIQQDIDSQTKYLNGQFYQLREGKLDTQIEDSSNTELVPTFVFLDSCLSQSKRPSAQLKNYLFYLAKKKGYTEFQVIVYRNNAASFLLKLKLQECPDPWKVVGWERTSQGKLGPKLADLGLLSDPTQLASQAVDLNLKLMKWRVAPELDLDIIKQQKVLLLGAGTLGCYVARALLGWGVCNIKFVDSGRVSYSNPVRQPLFNFEDCFSDNGRGMPKASAAANALKKIFPGVNAQGYEIEVPMIGHPITDEQKQGSQYGVLDDLFNQSDVVFLLMDSREARWLPTVMGVAKGKIVINAALGFDSYLVMRHGNISSLEDKLRLGCYFCNDIVAPEDSLSDRTLDQMCTVTRPGAALMASSLAVELLVSILQHPDKSFANAVENNDDRKKHEEKVEKVEKFSKFGACPHQIRGFLNTFSQNKFHIPNYEHCSACSQKVVDQYIQNGWEFVKDCLNNQGYLEELCGLSKVQEEAELAAQQLLEELSFEEKGEIDSEDLDWIN